MDVKHGLELYEEVGKDLKFLSASSVRTKVMIGLNGGSCSLGDLREKLDLEAPPISRALNQFAKQNYVVKDRDLYFLSQTGKIIFRRLMESIRTIHVLKKFDSLWLNHDMKDIPVDLLRTIGNLENSELVESEPTDIFKPFDNYNNLLRKSNKIKGLSPIFRPNFLNLFRELIEKGDDVEFIFTGNILDKIVKNLDSESVIKMKEFISGDELKIWKINCDVKVAFTITEKFLSLGLFSSSGCYDPTRDLVSSDHDALKWGNDLFDYYKKKSERINF